MTRAKIASMFAFIAVFLASVPGYSLDLSRILGRSEGESASDTFRLIHVTDLKALMADSGAHVHIYDANVETTRAKFGVIPGAVLLNSDDNYDLSVLPADKSAKLVFYCANTH